MKKHEYIRQLSVKELAKLLVKEVEVDEGNYDYDDNWRSDYWTYYKSSNGQIYQTKEDALQSTIEWLNDDILK